MESLSKVTENGEVHPNALKAANNMLSSPKKKRKSILIEGNVVLAKKMQMRMPGILS